MPTSAGKREADAEGTPCYVSGLVTDSPRPAHPETSDAGAPAAAAVEDEFAGIPSPRRRFPWFSLLVVLLAAYLVYHQRSDLLFALSPSQPVDLGDARALTSGGAAPVNRYVRLAGPADRENALILDTQGSWEFTQFFRLLGTQSRVFVHRRPDPLPVAMAESSVYTGRLLRVRDLSYAASIRRYFAARVSATHLFDPMALRAALAQGRAFPIPLADRAGEVVALQANTVLSLDLGISGMWRIDVPRDRFPDPAAARTWLVAHGFIDPVAAPQAEQSPGFHTVRARLDEASKAKAVSALADLDPHVRIHPARLSLQSPVADIAADGASGLRIGSGANAQRAEVGAVLAARIVEPVQIPEDALLLLEGEQPRQHLKSVVIVGFFVVFALLNLLALRRAA